MTTWIIKEAGDRLDKVISHHLKDVTRSHIQKLIKEEAVLVNHQSVKSNYIVRIGDCIEVTMPEPKPLDVVAVPMDLDIVYEDQDLLILNKPKNSVVHPAPGHLEDTLVNGIMHHCKKDLSGINGVLRPGIVHRIDKDTTGLLLVCKNDHAHVCIAKQLKDHSLDRTYEAIVHGHIKAQTGTIDASIARNKIHRKKMAIDPIQGRRAVTHYTVLGRYTFKGANYTHVRCQLETGRTHQIRVHMTSMFHPLLGDTTYGSKQSHLNLDGQCLHAKTIGFVHPSTNTWMQFDSELPDYFQSLLRMFQRTDA